MFRLFIAIAIYMLFTLPAVADQNKLGNSKLKELGY